MLFPELQTNKNLILKPTGYTNTGRGITEPQRRIIKALSSGKGNYLKEHEKMNGCKTFRCIDSNKNIVGQNFKKVVVANLVLKGYLILYGNKYFLK